MLKEQIDQDLVKSLKEHQEQVVSTLRMLKSAIKNAEIQKQKELDEADLLSLIQSQIKARRDSAELYRKGNRPELAEKEEAEIAILAKYLPEQMDDEEIRAKVQEAITKTDAGSAQEMGKVMGVLMPELKGKADPSTVSRIVKEELVK